LPRPAEAGRPSGRDAGWDGCISFLLRKKLTAQKRQGCRTKTLRVLVFGVWGFAPNSTQGRLGSFASRNSPGESQRLSPAQGIGGARSGRGAGRRGRSDSGAPDSPVPAAGGDAPISEWRCPTTPSLQHSPNRADAPISEWRRCIIISLQHSPNRADEPT
jgi:hypothetical protein